MCFPKVIPAAECQRYTGRRPRSASSRDRRAPCGPECFGLNLGSWRQAFEKWPIGVDQEPQEAAWARGDRDVPDIPL